MNTRLTNPKRTAASLQDISDCFQDRYQPQDPTSTPDSSGTPTRFAQEVRNGLQLVLIVLLLSLLVMDHFDYLRSLIHWPALAGQASKTEDLKAPNNFVKQQYHILSQTLVAKKQMIKHAKQVVEMSNRDIERYTFDMSVAEMALNKIRSEYDVTGLDE